MKLKEKVKEFAKLENELKIELLKEIRKEFDSYGKVTVYFHPNCEYDDNVELWDECIDTVYPLCSPFIMDKHCQIDGTARADYMTLDEDGLKLHCVCETGIIDWMFVTLEKPSWELTVEDLGGLVELLQNPLIKQVNNEINK